MFGRTAWAQREAAAEQQPVQQQESPSAAPAAAASKGWVVTTTTGSTYFGRLFMEKDPQISEVSVTTRSGRQILIRGHQIVERIPVEQLASVPMAWIVVSRCRWSRITPALVREFFISGEAPFRATIHEIRPGRSITIRRLDATSTELRSVSFDELEQIRRPPEVNDPCPPADYEIPLANRAEVRIRLRSTADRQSTGLALLIIGGVGLAGAIVGGFGTKIAYEYDKMCGGTSSHDVDCMPGNPSISLQSGYGQGYLATGILAGVGLPLVIIGIGLLATSDTARVTK